MPFTDTLASPTLLLSASPRAPLRRTAAPPLAHAARSFCFSYEQIQFLVLQNRQGKTRLSKWYIPMEEDAKRNIEAEVHRLVTNRDSKFTNFIQFEVDDTTYKVRLPPPHPPTHTPPA